MQKGYNMRSLIPISVLLSTLLGIVNLSSALTQAEVDSLWEEARKKYLAHLLQTRGFSPARRSIKRTRESKIMSENTNIYSFFEKLAMERYGLTKRQAGNMTTPAACRMSGTNCDGSANWRYRNFDGTCNNVNNPLWGSVNHPFNRLLPAAYEDGFNDPRGRMRNSYLPNARLISTEVHFDRDIVNPYVTNMVPQFGQFLDHDLTLTPENGSPCCMDPNSDIDCWPIEIPRNDSFYTRLSTPQNCIDFTRSTTCTTQGVREQINANTAYIDLSQVYGNRRNRTEAIRDHTLGHLVTSTSNNGVPTVAQVGVQAPGEFVAGDNRITVMPGLTVMHNLFLLEHNRIADELRQITGNNDDDFLYQEARRILIALYQNIVYSEYLPIILGAKTMARYNLDIPDNQYSQYDPGTDASIINSFAAASYRFGHSMVSGLVKLIASNNNEVGSYFIRDHYFESTPFKQDNGKGYDLILRGLMTQNSPEMDRFITDGVTNFLFKPPNQDFGQDLAAFNIQRGRDHGIRAYNDYRELCGLSSITSWDNKPADVTKDGWDYVSAVYGVGNGPLVSLDLFVGGLIEAPSDGAVTGPTFQCLNAIQFQRLKDGDRYFFSHNTGDYSFTPEQIQETKKQKLSDIICRNSDQPDAPMNVFLVPSSNNPMVPCSNHEPLNLQVFTNGVPPPTPPGPPPPPPPPTPPGSGGGGGGGGGDGSVTLNPILAPFIPPLVVPIVAPVVNPFLPPHFGRSLTPGKKAPPKNMQEFLANVEIRF